MRLESGRFFMNTTEVFEFHTPVFKTIPTLLSIVVLQGFTLILTIKIIQVAENVIDENVLAAILILMFIINSMFLSLMFFISRFGLTEVSQNLISIRDVRKESYTPDQIISISFKSKLFDRIHYVEFKIKKEKSLNEFTIEFSKSDLENMKLILKKNGFGHLITNK